jgi:hypothetical protein
MTVSESRRGALQLHMATSVAGLRKFHKIHTRMPAEVMPVGTRAFFERKVIMRNGSVPAHAIAASVKSEHRDPVLLARVSEGAFRSLEF